MIVFVTAYDSATRANHAVARRILQDNELFLDGESASKREMMLALERHDGPLFAMTHGEPDRLLAHGHDAAPPALCTADIAEARLAARSVHESGEVNVPFSAEYCLVQLQQDLVVWSPGKDEARPAPWARGKRQFSL